MPNNNILSVKRIASLFIVALMTISFVACNGCSTVERDIHGQAILFATDRKADKVASAKAILHQMGMTAQGTAFRSLFTFDR